ncbi:unnamed protein product [Macrosiphum euphorbiae]|uniref:Regulatory protein zeste n=1 Tax=Macrosiphum euphorbiae TaxID=13131 RepID=A0AAV0WFC6_9HEMI|nr:unnamed protein product [Macrosiphum euphorbiae]
MNPPKKFKGKSVTFEQKQTLVSFKQEHPELHKGKFSPSFTSKHSKDLWTQISNELNSIVGATKDPSKWKKCWIDLKSNTKSKSAEIKKNSGKTGGGMNESEELEDLENQILVII